MSTMIKILAISLLFVLGGVALGDIKASETQSAESDSTESKIDSTKAEAPPEISHKVIAYYFHGTRRCFSCKKIEAYSQEAIETGFAEALESGELEWLIVNTDRLKNKHFLDDYQLYTRSLVLAKIEDGEETEWKNLEKVWQLLGDKDGFIQYVQTEVKSLLGQD